MFAAPPMGGLLYFWTTESRGEVPGSLLSGNDKKRLTKSDFYQKWRGRRWRFLAHQNMCGRRKCNSLHPGWRQAEWWADCQTTRGSARLSPGTGALSWGHFAWQKRPLPWSLPAQGCVSTWPARPFQAAHRNTRGTPSFPSLPSCCGRLWLVLEEGKRPQQWESIKDEGEKKCTETDQENLDSSYSVTWGS